MSTPQLHIAIYYPWVYLRGGIERLLLELIRHSRHRWTILTNRYDPQGTFPEYADIPLVTLPEIPVERSLGRVAQAAATIVRQRVDFSPYDALMVSSDDLGNLIVYQRHRPPTFCYCHTPLKIAYDIHTRAHFFANERGTWLHRASIELFRRFDRPTWRAYDHVFCNSRETYQRLLRAELVPPSRAEVLHPGVSHDTFRPTWQWNPYFLVAGRIMWTKNIPLAVAAFRRFRRRRASNDPFRLVIAGMVDEKSKDLLRTLQAEAAADPAISIEVTPTDARLAELYAHAYAALNMSFNEDWGISVIEAMAAGRAVIALNRGGPAESIQPGVTGILCEPTEESVAQAFEVLAADPKRAQTMGRAAHHASQRYDWSRFAQRIDAYADDLVARNRQKQG